MTIAEKLGGWILNILTCASNRTRRDDTWVDEDEYEDDEEYEDENHGKQHESRRARILRGALARRKRLAEKFINQMCIRDRVNGDGLSRNLALSKTSRR